MAILFFLSLFFFDKELNNKCNQVHRKNRTKKKVLHGLLAHSNETFFVNINKKAKQMISTHMGYSLTAPKIWVKRLRLPSPGLLQL